jgi:hypothetical protein
MDSLSSKTIDFRSEWVFDILSRFPTKNPLSPWKDLGGSMIGCLAEKTLQTSTTMINQGFPEVNGSQC